MKRQWAALLGGFLLALFGSPLQAQFLASPSFMAISVDFPQIQVRAKLVASTPLPINPGTVTIAENGVPVSDVAVATSTAKQILLLLLDRSSSLEGAMPQVKKSAATFVSALPANLKISVISFASDIEINQEFTTDRAALSHAIGVIRPWGGTMLYDAACVAIEALYANSDPRDLRTLVLFTDGRDETPVTREQLSTHNLSDVLTLAQKKTVRVITVGMGELIDADVLKKLARETRGWYLFAPKPAALSEIYRKIARRLELERHYNLSYLTPTPDRDGKPRLIRVDLKLPNGTETALASYVAPLPLRGAPVIVPISPIPVLPPTPVVVPPVPSQAASASSSPASTGGPGGIEILEGRRKRPAPFISGGSMEAPPPDPEPEPAPASPAAQPATGASPAAGLDLPAWGEMK